MSVVGQVLYVALTCFLVVLIFRLVMDYVFQFARSWQPGKAMVVVLEATYTVTDPPLKLLRRFIPPLRMRGRGARPVLLRTDDHRLHPDLRREPAVNDTVLPNADDYVEVKRCR